MTGYNGRGPENKGPMTGRGAGDCSYKENQEPRQPQESNEEQIYGLGRGGLPRGSGRGRASGIGRGGGRFYRQSA